MWASVDAAEECEHHAIIERYQARIREGPNEGLHEVKGRRLQEAAMRYGIEFDWFTVNGPLTPEGSDEWFARRREAERLARAVGEERWRRSQRWAGIITPILSLLVALTALITTRACLPS